MAYRRKAVRSVRSRSGSRSGYSRVRKSSSRRSPARRGGGSSRTSRNARQQVVRLEIVTSPAGPIQRPEIQGQILPAKQRSRY